MAVFGWMIQRHGLYDLREKIIGTIGYTGFVVVIMLGLKFAYSKLDLAANDLAYTYKINSSTDQSLISDKGIVAMYISRSPEYCSELKESLNIKNCTKYYNYMYINISLVLFGWAFCMCLFWYESIWYRSREK